MAEKNSEICCDVHDCKHCDCDCDKCKLKKIKVCSCNDCEENKETTMCDSYKKK